MLGAAMMHRLQQADPSAGDSITISRSTFDQLIALGELARQATMPTAGTPTLTVRRDGDGYRATLADERLATIEASGASLLEAVNERELPRLVEQWQRSTVCMRCGAVAYPANVVLGVKYAAGGRPGSA